MPTPLIMTAARRGGLAVLGIALTAGGLIALDTPASALPAGCTQSGSVVTCTYTTPGSSTPFTVPAGVSRADLQLRGASGGGVDLLPEDTDTRGGAAGTVAATVTLTPGASLLVQVASVGLPAACNDEAAAGGAGGQFGGAAGGSSTNEVDVRCGGGGGGGGSFLVPSSGGFLPLAAAGGGGGAVSYQDGNPGGPDNAASPNPAPAGEAGPPDGDDAAGGGGGGFPGGAACAPSTGCEGIGGGSGGISYLKPEVLVAGTDSYGTTSGPGGGPVAGRVVITYTDPAAGTTDIEQCGASDPTCVVNPPAGKETKFQITAFGGNESAELFGILNGGFPLTCNSVGGALSPDWVQFGFTDPRDGKTWSKKIRVIGTKPQSRAAARSEMAQTQICFAAPYKFVVKRGEKLSKPTGSTSWEGLLAHCSSDVIARAKAAKPDLARPCILNRSLIQRGDGFVVRVRYFVPNGELDPQGRSVKKKKKR